MSSNKYTAASGRECQTARAVYPRWEFTLRYGGDAWLRDQTQNITPYAPLTGDVELEALSGLFLQCLGSYGEFFYLDPDDNSRENQYVTTTFASEAQNAFQLYYSWGSGPFTPGFTAPVSGIQTLSAVYLNGGLVDPSTYTLDATRTQVVFPSGAPNPGVITADFSFYFRCRFSADAELYEQWAKNLWENKELKFISVKP